MKLATATADFKNYADSEAERVRMQPPISNPPFLTESILFSNILKRSLQSDTSQLKKILEVTI